MAACGGQRQISPVAWVIRWSNDNLTIEMPVIMAILLVMLVMALSTELIDVHTALGAFVDGILVGRGAGASS
jgi:Kef-type K+ transport system membrane component KefB